MSWAKPEDAERWQRAVGAQIRALREAKGWTQPKLAEASDISVAYISSVELGHRNVSLVNLCVLASSLGVDVAELVRDVPRAV